MGYNEKVLALKRENSDTYSDLDVLTSPKRISLVEFKRSKLRFFQGLETSDSELYKKFRYYQELAAVDQNHFIELLNTKKLVIKGQQHVDHRQPIIYCSFHYGSYRLVNPALGINGVEFSIPVSRDNISNASTYEKVREDLSKTFSFKLKILDAEDKSTMLRMIKNIKKGESLMFYVDGFRGSGKLDDIKNLQVVDFMGTEIYTRKGVAFLSHYLNVPIVPIISERHENETISIEFLEPIHPQGERETYCRTALQEIWDLFSKRVSKDPSQWESLVFASDFLVDKNPTEDESSPAHLGEESKYAFNSDRYDFIERGDIYLLDCLKNVSLKLTENIYKFLNKLSKDNLQLPGSQLKQLIKNEDVLNQFLTHKILIPK